MDATIYEMIDGKMSRTNEPRNSTSNNFVIVCRYGDWSGFRSLCGCVSQFAELEKIEAGCPDRDFRVVER